METSALFASSSVDPGTSAVLLKQFTKKKNNKLHVTVPPHARYIKK